MALGLLLIAAALLLTAKNLLEESGGEQAAHEALTELEQEQNARMNGKDGQKVASPAGETASATVWQPDYVRDPQMEMPTKKIDGNYYIGSLEIDALGLKLPIMSEWSYTRLRKAPCRYSGSAYLGDMVIAGHNYKYHFGHLSDLQIGDEVRFTDIDGNVFHYEVIEIETLAKRDVERMLSGEWDLTLFTCTYGGRSRVTVRCARTQE